MSDRQQIDTRFINAPGERYRTKNGNETKVVAMAGPGDWRGGFGGLVGNSLLNLAGVVALTLAVCAPAG